MEKYYAELNISLSTVRMGKDICVSVFGGDKPHIGAVSVAEPYPSLSNDGSTSSSLSRINFAGHKDYLVADRMAEKLASALNCKVSVACGIHYDSVSPGLFEAVFSLADRMVSDIISAAGGGR